MRKLVSLNAGRGSVQEMFEKMATYSKLPSLQEFGKYDEVIELVRHAPKDSIVIGAHDSEFSTDAVTIPAKQQFNAIILGKKGSGKSMQMRLFLDQFYNRLQRPCFSVDAYWEYHTSVFAQNKPELVERLKEYGLYPKGIPLITITPNQCIEEGSEDMAGVSYTIELSDFKRIKKVDERILALCGLLSVDAEGGEPAKRQIDEWINNLPNTFEEWLKELAKQNLKKLEKKDTLFGLAQRPSLPLLQRINSFLIRGAIGKGNHFYIPHLLMMEGKPRAVNMQLSGESSAEPITSIYLKLALLDICSDRIRFRRFGRGFLKIPPTILIDEADVVAPRHSNPPSKQIIERLFSKMRKEGITTICATQEPSQITQRIMKNMDYILTSRLFTLADKSLLKVRGMSDDDIELVMQDLEWKKENPVKEHALIYSDCTYETYYPLPSCSMHFEEKI